MFTSLRLVNFKSYQDSDDIALKPLTVLIGPNNSGKSSILQSLLLLKQTLQDKTRDTALVTTGPHVNLGSFFDIVRGGKTGSNETFRIEVAIDARYSFPYGHLVEASGANIVGEKLAVEFRYDSDENTVKVARSSVLEDGEPVLEVRRSPTGLHSPQLVDREDALSIDLSHFVPIVRPRALEKRTKLDNETVNLLIASQMYTQLWGDVFEKTAHIPPLRVRVPWYSAVATMPPADLGPGGESLLRLLASTEKVGTNKKALIEHLDAWISTRFQMLKKLKLAKVDPAGTIRSLHGDEVSGFENINVAGMGEGLSQLLPIIAKSVMIEAGSCLLIEQPEIHLHPAAQANLGDLLIAAVKQEEGRQVIAETHSEHFLLRIRRRIAEGKIEPDKVGVLFVEKVGAESKIRPLTLTEKGQFSEWPDGFFEEGYREALALAQASSERRTTRQG